jgi:hypothetical protein
MGTGAEARDRPPAGLPHGASLLGLISPDAPSCCTGTVHVLRGSVGQQAIGNVTLACDGDTRLIIDPGVFATHDELRLGLAQMGESPEKVTDVVRTLHRPSQAIDIGLFPNACVHYPSAAAPGGCAISPCVRLVSTPGHSRSDLTVLVGTHGGVVAVTHLWRSAGGADDDTADPDALHASRLRVLRIASHIVPSHGPIFRPGPDTPG